MKKRIHNFENVMRKIIKSVLDNNKIPNLHSDFEREALIECIERKFIVGIKYERTVTGKAFFDFQKNISVTYKGIFFLENRHPNVQQTVSLILSIVAIIVAFSSAAVSFLAQYSNILDNLVLIFD